MSNRLPLWMVVFFLAATALAQEDQGKKDGAAEAFEAIGRGVKRAEEAVPHKNPGRPKKGR